MGTEGHQVSSVWHWPSNGNLYVTDGYGNARVHHFAADGRLIQSWGEPGTGPGQFYLPHGICIDAGGHVLVADRENDRIQIFILSGAYQGEWTDVQFKAESKRPTACRARRKYLDLLASTSRILRT